MGAEAIRINRPLFKKVVELSLQARKDQNSAISEQAIPAVEKEFVTLVKKYGQKIGDKDFALTAIFMTTAYDFGGKTSQLFKKVNNLEKLSRLGWLFNPVKVVAAGPEATEVACKLFFGPGGYNIRNSSAQHYHNCEFLAKNYQGKLRNYFLDHNNDAHEIVEDLVVRPRARAKKGLRRYGPKIARLAVERIGKWNLYSLNNLERIGVPIDFQKARLFIQTLAVAFKGEVGTHWMTEVVGRELSRLCKKYNLDPEEISDAMYTIGSSLCSAKPYPRHDVCPLARQCKIMISRKGYDQGGKFSQTDQLGRFSLGGS